MVRLKAFVIVIQLVLSKFQFLMVRLKESPLASNKVYTAKFQFLMVRLKEFDFSGLYSILTKFQFLMVRLKVESSFEKIY